MPEMSGWELVGNQRALEDNADRDYQRLGRRDQRADEKRREGRLGSRQTFDIDRISKIAQEIAQRKPAA